MLRATALLDNLSSRLFNVEKSEMLSRSSDIDAPIHRDPLSEVLQDLQLGTVSSGYGELAHPWGIAFEQQDVARFHFVVSGTCWIHSPSGEWIALNPGDAVLLPDGAQHALVSEKKERTKPYEQVRREYVGQSTYRMHEGGEGKISKIFCCSVFLRNPGLRSLLDLMPSMLLVRSVAKSDPALPILLETMAQEVLMERMGSATILARLADVVIAQVIRSWVENHRDVATGWLAAIHDPKLGRVLAAIHREPGYDWTVEALAAIACVSRSVFTERFALIVGMPPARYVTHLRMQIASEWLRVERASVAQVAERLGYESEASFSRAFKRHVGMSPSELRRI